MPRSVFILSALLIVTIIILVVTAMPVIEWVEWIRVYIQSFGAFGIIVFVVLYSVVTLLMIPVLPLTLMAGLVYGMWGFPLVLLSATIAACIAFLLARYLLHTYVSALIGDKLIFLAIKRAVNREEWKITILLRMSPMLSFAMQNYLLAITDIRFWPYAVGSVAGMMPAIAVQVYLASFGSHVEYRSVPPGVLIAGAAATIIVILLISYRTKQAINQIKTEYQNQ